jgi:glutamine synthetase
MGEQQHRPEFLRLVFTDITGKTRSIELSFDKLHEVVKEGVFFDGSSVPGYAAVNASDLLLKPTASMPLLVPWDPEVAMLLCSVYDVDGKPHPGDPRHILSRVAAKAMESGFALKVGSELEFFLVHESSTSISPADNGGYFATPPEDGALDFRRSVVRTLGRLGIFTTSHHHEVAKGQHEVGLIYGPVTEAADEILLSRMAISELALKSKMTATFMPKPFSGQNGSGMHLHQSLWDPESKTNLFSSGSVGELSELAGHYVAGLFRHAGALAAILSPTVNSYKRLRPGFEAPTRIAWGPRNRTTMVRVPQFNGIASKARIELRCPDPLCSPHLAMAAILAAGMDGVMHKLKVPLLTSEDLYETPAHTTSLPGSLMEATEALRCSSVMKDLLGPSVEKLVGLREKEWKAYLEANGGVDEEHITSWEIQQYLHAN